MHNSGVTTHDVGHFFQVIFIVNFTFCGSYCVVQVFFIGFFGAFSCVSLKHSHAYFSMYKSLRKKKMKNTIEVCCHKRPIDARRCQKIIRSLISDRNGQTPLIVYIYGVKRRIKFQNISENVLTFYVINLYFLH